MTPPTAEGEIRALCRAARSTLLRLRAIGPELRAARDYAADLACDAEADLTSAHRKITRLAMERAALASALTRNHDRARSLALGPDPETAP